jgi:multicomponent Na+:H+ antiporter subunit D
VAIVFIGGALSFVYMFQTYGARFWVNQPADEATTRVALGLVTVVAVAIVAIGVFPEPLLGLTEQAVRMLPERTP